MKLKTKKLVLIVISTFMLIFSSCQDDLEGNLIQNNSNPVIKEYSFKELNQIPEFNKSYKQFRKDYDKLRARKRSISDIVIDSSLVKVIELDGQTTYTMAIVNDSENKSYYENLIVQTSPTDSVTAYIANYPITSEVTYLTEHDSYSYNSSTPTFEEIDLETNTSQNKMDLTCHYVYLCDQGGAIHVSGSNCTQKFTLTFCHNSGGGGSGGDGGSTGSTSGDGSGTGGSSTGSTGSDPSGEPIDNPTNVHTSPVIPTEYTITEMDEVVNAKNCEKLNKMITPIRNSSGLPTENPVKTALKTNQNQVTSNNNEQGFRLFYDQSTNSFVAASVPNTNTNDCGELPIGFNNATVGFFHTHPSDCSENGLYEMFSHKDILLLEQAIRKHNAGNSTYPDGTSVDYSNFVITVATVNGTYAIKITDIDKFKNIAGNIISSGENLNKFLDKFAKMQSKDKFASTTGVENTDRGLNEKNILYILNDLFDNSLSLHRANNDFTSWDRLVIENNAVTPKSCN